ncbi:MAG TPA: glycosyltransferase family 4 protein, partial [Gammaproteobacteria bacterium]|nr:glycosyltransferase family 4 protein [Gammaproteobacteria bacterium]
MHVVLVISSLNAGGAERVLSELANVWVSNGCQISLVTFSATTSNPFYPLDPKIFLVQLDKTRVGFSFLMRLKNIFVRIVSLRRAIQKLNSDVVLSFADVTNITTLIATIGLKTPVLVSERTHPAYHQLPKFYQKLRQIFYPIAASVIVQTNSAAAYFNTNRFKNIKIIPNAVLRPIQSKVANTSSSVVKNIVSVGRLHPVKNFEMLIKILPELLKKSPHLILTIYGEGSERLNLEHLIHSLGLHDKVSLPGTIQNIQDALIKSDLFIFPSQYEGFPNALCEAMAVGLPVIASDCSGNIDIVRDGIDGRLFPVGDMQTLTKITLELLEDGLQRQRLAEHAKEICDRFEPDRIFKLW